MKKFVAIATVLVSAASFAQDVQYANIVSVTPVKENIQVVKQQCGGSSGYNQQEPGYVGRIVGTIGGAAVGSRFGKGNGKVATTAVGAGVGYAAGSAYDNNGNVQPNCRNITTYEPTFGGFLIVYELDGRQYTTRSKTFPEGRTIPVQMQPTPINQ